MELVVELDNLYQMWLMDSYPEEIHNKDDLIKLYENKKGYEKFVKEMNELLGDE